MLKTLHSFLYLKILQQQQKATLDSPSELNNFYQKTETIRKQITFHVGVISVNDTKYMFHLSYVKVAVAIAQEKLTTMRLPFQIKVSWSVS